MSHKKTPGLYAQAHAKMESMYCPGRSKLADKQAAMRDWYAHPESRGGLTLMQATNAALRDHIYSSKTYSDYAQHQHYFLEWAHDTYHCKTLDDCRSHVDEWLTKRVDEGKSAWTVKLEASAIGKLYGEPTYNFAPTPQRVRSDIVRSRDTAVRDYGFSEKNNADIINFERGTGLRRGELAAVRGTDLRQMEGGGYALWIKGKGGRTRLAPIVGSHSSEIVARCQAAGDNKIWQSVPSHMDVHNLRSEYACIIYSGLARPLDQVPMEDRYYCRGDLSGTVYDRQAMQAASEALGHSRVSVIASNYLRNL